MRRLCGLRLPQFTSDGIPPHTYVLHAVAGPRRTRTPYCQTRTRAWLIRARRSVMHGRSKRLTKSDDPVSTWRWNDCCESSAPSETGSVYTLRQPISAPAQTSNVQIQRTTPVRHRRRGPWVSLSRQIHHCPPCPRVATTAVAVLTCTDNQA